MPGGVAAGPVESTRNAFAEQSVQSQQSLLGSQQQISADLEQLQPYFDLAGSSNVSSSLDGLFNAFSQLSVNPNDTVSRQAVLNAAQQVAVSFQHNATGLASTSNAVDNEMRSAVDAINRLAGQIAQINLQRMHNSANAIDAGVDATLHSTLEELSQYADFKALQQPDGTVSVYLGGQTPLVMGDTTLTLQTDFSAPQTTIRDSNGKDITKIIQMAKLAACPAATDTTLPSLT